MAGLKRLNLGDLNQKIDFVRRSTTINSTTGEQTLTESSIRSGVWANIGYVGSPSAGSSEEESNDQRIGKMKIEVVCRFFTGLRFEDIIEFNTGRFRIYSIQIMGKNAGYKLRAELRDDDTPGLPTGATYTL